MSNTPTYRRCKKNFVAAIGLLLEEGRVYKTSAEMLKFRGLEFVEVSSGPYTFYVPVQEYFQMEPGSKVAKKRD